MTWLNQLRALLHRSQFHREMDEEIAFHLEAAERELSASGLTADEARRQARLRFGSPESVQERVHAESAPRLESVLHDVRFALRLLKKSPVFTAVVVLSLALGIGANVAVFTVMNAVMLQSLPVENPESLVVLHSAVKKDFFPEKYMQDYEGDTYEDASTGLSLGSSVPTVAFDGIRKNATSFDSTFAFVANDQKVNVGLGNRAASGTLQGVSGGYFGGLGVVPALGRMIAESDDEPAAPPVVVISYQFFRSQLGGDASVLGRTITINDTPAQVIGVAPPDFFGLDPVIAPDFWAPLSLYRTQWERSSGDEKIDSPFVWWLTVVGRLKPGISQQQAQAEASVLFARAINAPSNPTDPTIPSLRITAASRGLGSLRRSSSSSLWLLIGIAAIVLLIACANVAALMLARATSRRHELATRLSLGASRGRLIRQLMSESLVLALAGGTIGVAASNSITAMLVRLLNNRSDPVGLGVHVSIKVLMFAFTVSVASSLVFGLAPALRATKIQISSALKQGRTQQTGDNRFRSGKALVAAQIALCVLLVVAAGLMLRTLNKLQRVNLGFAAGNLSAFTVRPGLNGYAKEKVLRYYEELLRRVTVLPGVGSATYSQYGPIGEGWSSSMVYIPGFNTPEKRSEYFRHIVGDRYFDALGIPIVLGRALSGQDTASSPCVVVINETMMRKYFGGRNPIGREMVLGTKQSAHQCQVIGVAADVRYARIRDDVPPTIYFPISQVVFVLDQVSFLVRANGDPRQLQGAVESVALQLDPMVPVVAFRQEEAVIARHLSLDIAFARLSSAFAGFGLLLACIGLYGTVSYTVARRTGEIGVRLALGANRADILGMVLRDTVRVVLVGLAVGFPLTWMCSRLLGARLYGLSPHDSVTLAAAGAALLLVTLLAGAIPARRASAIDPTAALRHE
jgi:predicted permease